MAITYNRGFTHREWVDNVDRVQAGGDNGFNSRFHELEAEFERLSVVVRQIDTAIASVGHVVPAPVTVGLAPVLVPLGQLENLPPWSPIIWRRFLADGSTVGTFVELPAGVNAVAGVLPLNLPNGVKLVSLKVLGELTGGSFGMELYREQRLAPFDLARLVVLPGFSAPGAPAVAIPGSPTFTGDTHLFYLVVTARRRTPNDEVKLRGFQITYEP